MPGLVEDLVEVVLQISDFIPVLVALVYKVVYCFIVSFSGVTFYEFVGFVDGVVFDDDNVGYEEADTELVKDDGLVDEVVVEDVDVAVVGDVEGDELEDLVVADAAGAEADTLELLN